MARTKAAERAALHAAILEQVARETIVDEIRLRAEGLRRSGPVTLAQLAKLVDRELDVFYAEEAS